MPARRKLIGLTGPSYFTPNCMEMVEDFLDANFVLLYHNTEANTNYWLDKVDGIVLSGGVDIHPSVYGESVWTNQNLSKFDIRRDARELQIIDYCIEKKKPLLGICRGHQLLGVRYGLAMAMDISHSSVCHNGNRQGIEVDPREPIHYIKIIDQEAFFSNYQMPNKPEERNTFDRILAVNRQDHIWVNSFHHQAIVYKKDYHKAYQNINIIGTAYVGLEGCENIIELMEGERWVSCQWHPEFDWKENTASRVILTRFKAILGEK